jgi:hypothetical protein
LRPDIHARIAGQMFIYPGRPADQPAPVPYPPQNRAGSAYDQVRAGFFLRMLYRKLASESINRGSNRPIEHAVDLACQDEIVLVQTFDLLGILRDRHVNPKRS